MIIMILIIRQCYPATSPPALPATASTLCSGIERTLAHPYTGDKYICTVHTHIQKIMIKMITMISSNDFRTGDPGNIGL